jgi:hypothetical protein
VRRLVGSRISTCFAMSLLPSLAVLGCASSEPPGSPQIDAPIESSTAPHEPERRDPEPQFQWQRHYQSDESAGVFAVVPPGATLHRTSRLDKDGWTYDGVHDGVVRVLGIEGETVEIELDWELSDRVLHCVHGSLADLGLRVFIHRDQLEDVTSEGQSVSLGVDEGINVAPGVLVSHVLDMVEPELLTIGKFYTPASRDSLPVPLAEQAAGSLSYGSGAGTPSGKHDLCFTSWSNHLYERSASDPPRALVGGPCLQIAGSVRFNPPGTACAGGKGGFGMTCQYGTRDAWTVAAGTELTWPKGGPAGRTYQDVLVNERPQVRGDVTCFNPTLTCGALELFRVCVPSSSVAYTPVESLDPGGLLHTLPVIE